MGKYPKLAIGELCRIEKGQTGIASAEPGEYPLVTTGPNRKSSRTYQFDTKAVCIPLVSSTGHGKKTLNYVHYQEGKFAVGTILAAVIPKKSQILNASFLHRYLEFYKDRKIVPLMRGAANVSLAVKDIAKIEIPIPPINKQKTFIELFNKANSFGQKLLAEFGTQVKYLSKLRQAILQEAIEGKLTADWRKKHPVKKGDPNTDAAALLEQIKAEKQTLIAAGKLKNQKPLAPIKPDEILSDLPNNWECVRIGNILYLEYGKGLSKENRKSTGKYPVYGANGVMCYCDTPLIEGKSIIVGRKGSAGAMNISKDSSWPTDVTYYIQPIPSLEFDYLFHLLKSVNLEKMAKGVKPGLNRNEVHNLIIKLPPLAEQQAIVERVDRLLAMVDDLEQQVKTRQQQAEQLMQSVLREAFEQN